MLTNYNRAMLRFVATFLICLLVLFTLDILTPVQEHVILPFTTIVAQVSVLLMHAFDHSVISRGNDIINAITGSGIEIVAGCNGVEAVLILVSAVLAFPAPWRHKLIGIGIGFLAIQTLNLVRIISLYYLHEWNQVWFEWFHLYLWQALIVLDALVFWLIWLRFLPRSPAARPV
jgi:exosortase H (IPTLxxWG-CTERM-specific)